MRTFAGAMDIPIGSVNGSHLELAQKVLSGFTILGAVENLRDSASAFTQTVGWRPTARKRLLKKVILETANSCSCRELCVYIYIDYSLGRPNPSFFGFF